MLKSHVACVDDAASDYGYSINERMRFAGHRDESTYAAAYQSRISTVDGQATFFELGRQNAQIHRLFRGYSLNRDYNYRPELPEWRRHQLEEQSSTVVGPGSWRPGESMTGQKRYDYLRGLRDRALREGHFSHGHKSTENHQPYESDFVQTRRMMPERDRLAEDLFQAGSLRVGKGVEVMADLIQLVQSRRQDTFCRSLNNSGAECDACGYKRTR